MILLVKFEDENGPHYNYPGGGHQEGETLLQTAAREVKEETEADVEVGRLLVVRESAPFEVDYIYGDTHFLKLFFECQLKSGSEPRFPDNPDPHEVAVEWVPIDDLANLPVIPDISQDLIVALNGGNATFFEDDGLVAKELNKK
jgi:8-oxo-dGTP pyrophosphatase MutT (NUDIX family)